MELRTLVRVIIKSVIDVGISRLRGRGAFGRSRLVCGLWAELVLCSSLIAGSMGDLSNYRITNPKHQW